MSAAVAFGFFDSILHEVRAGNDRCVQLKMESAIRRGIISARHHVCGSAHAMTFCLLWMISQPNDMDSDAR
jgi:hypothetical protein